MNESSHVTIGRLATGKYLLVCVLALGNGKNGRHSYEFSYDYEVDRSLLLFVELTAESRNILLRMSTELGDRKSFDAFDLFRNIKSGLSEHEWGYRFRFKKSLFASDWDSFDGFQPFGFTLIQPPLTSSGLGDFTYSLHKPPDPYILSLHISNHRFCSVRIYKDIIARDVLSERIFGPEDDADY